MYISFSLLHNRFRSHNSDRNAHYEKIRNCSASRLITSGNRQPGQQQLVLFINFSINLYNVGEDKWKFLN